MLSDIIPHDRSSGANKSFISQRFSWNAIILYKSPPIALSVITCDKWIGINPIILHQDTWIINELQKSDHYL